MVAPTSDVEDAFSVLVTLYGFNIREFDRWHSELSECGAKTELAERRSLALQAAMQKNNDALLRHLEWMLLRWKYIQRLDFILPLARTAKKTLSGVLNENVKRRRTAQTKAAAWQKRAEKKWAEPQHAGKSAYDIARLIAGPDENPNTIRRKIKKLS